MSLEKLTALTAHISDYNLLMPEQFDSWMENGKMIPFNKKMGADQLVICRYQYDAVFTFEGYTGSPDMLMVIICAWLIENDNDRDKYNLAAPDIDVDMVDDNRANVEVTITFSESIDLVKDELGLIHIHGARWRIANSTVYDIDTAAVGDDQAAPTDLPYTRED